MSYRVDAAGFLVDDNGRRVGFKEVDGEEKFFAVFSDDLTAILKPDGDTFGGLGGGDMLAENNLSDLTDAAAARTNLELGTAAEEDTGAFDAAGTASSAVSTHNGVTDGAHGMTAYGASVVAVADEAALKALVNLEIGTDVAAFAATASQAEAEAGTETAVRAWTPQRIAQAIAALAEGGSGAYPTVEAITASSPYTLVTGDANKIKVGVDSSAQTVNITTAFNGLGCWIQWNAGAGTITLDANAGVNLNGLGDGVNIVLSAAAGMVQIIPTGTNTFNVVGAIGDLTVADVTDMSANARTFNQAANNAAMRNALGTGESHQFSFQIDEVADGAVFTAVMKAFAGTITGITTDCASGTCTLTGSINGTPLGGTANSVSTTETTQAHASDNDWAIDDRLAFTAASNSSCLGMIVTVTYTKTHA